jgi:prepilin-type N-terminal cleavage/methylation domain-containing protein
MKRLNGKKGFTIFEIVIALAILGLLYFALSDSLFGKKSSIEMENSIETSVKQISEAINKVGMQNTDARHPELKFMNTGTIEVWAKMGKKVMANDLNNNYITDEYRTGNHEYINSIGLNGLCHYYILPDTDYPDDNGTGIKYDNDTGNPGRGLSILQDCSPAAKAFSWDEKQMKNSEEVFAKYIQGVASGKVLILYDGGAIKSFNGLAHIGIGGNTTDAEVVVRFFMN